MKAEPSPGIRHGLLRFGVRALMLLVGLTALCFGWISHVIREAQVQSEAVAAIEAAGGLVLYDRERGPDGQYNLRAQPRWVVWLFSHGGKDYIANAVEVELTGRDASDADLESIGRLHRLELLTFWGATLTDAGLAHIKGLTHLKHLDLQDTEVTDSGLVHLTGLTGLRELDLSRTRISDAGLFNLAGLTDLEELKLSATRITDAGLVHLERLKDLRTLELNNTMIGAPGAEHLVSLTNLRLLDVAETRIDNFVAQDLGRALPKAKIIFTSLMYR
jgi:hypothetical protein